MSDSENRLLGRIQQLEGEISARDLELANFRQEVAQINEQLAELVELFKRELEIARTLQHSLLPTEVPKIPGFLFARKFEASMVRGGDYFDIFDLPDGFRFGILFSAASGHGMSALMMSVLLKLLGPLHAKQAKAPSDFVKAVFHEIDAKQQAGDSASIFYGVVDRRSLDLNFVSEGRCFAARIDSAGKVSPLTTTADELVKGTKPRLELVKQKLSPNDKLVFCTPGLFELHNPEGEGFGEERLLRILTARPDLGPLDLRNEILFQLRQFAKGTEYQRDVTVLVVEIQDNVIRLVPKS